MIAAPVIIMTQSATASSGTSLLLAGGGILTAGVYYGWEKFRSWWRGGEKRNKEDRPINNDVKEIVEHHNNLREADKQQQEVVNENIAQAEEHQIHQEEIQNILHSMQDAVISSKRTEEDLIKFIEDFKQLVNDPSISVKELSLKWIEYQQLVREHGKDFCDSSLIKKLLDRIESVERKLFLEIQIRHFTEIMPNKECAKPAVSVSANSIFQIRGSENEHPSSKNSFLKAS